MICIFRKRENKAIHAILDIAILLILFFLIYIFFRGPERCVPHALKRASKLMEFRHGTLPFYPESHFSATRCALGQSFVLIRAYHPYRANPVLSPLQSPLLWTTPPNFTPVTTSISRSALPDLRTKFVSDSRTVVLDFSIQKNIPFTEKKNLTFFY